MENISVISQYIPEQAQNLNIWGHESQFRHPCRICCVGSTRNSYAGPMYRFYKQTPARFSNLGFFFNPMPPHVLVDFVVLPPGHGRSVTDFWGWDAREAQLRCRDDVSGNIRGCSARRVLKSKFYQPTQTTVTAEILPFRENSHGRAGNRTRDLMISIQRFWPLDHVDNRTSDCIFHF